MRRSRNLVLGAALMSLAILAGACGSGENGTQGGGQKGNLTVGVSGAFAENQLVAEMYAQVLEKAGYTIKRQLDLGQREVSDPALFNGDIDIKPEYLSTELFQLDPNADPGSDAAANAELLRPMLEAKGVSLLNFSQVNDVNTWVVTAETAQEHSLAKVSDLKPVAGDLVLGGPPECPERPFCLKGLMDVYKIEFKEFKPLDVGGALTVEALKGGEIDVALLFSTDPVIKENGWVALEDDKNLQLADNIAPVIRTDVLNDDIASLLNAVSAKLTTDNISDLIGRVTIDNDDVETVAKDFLTQNGLLS
jgi:osmoprotectant transport system substrate-binding protein